MLSLWDYHVTSKFEEGSSQDPHDNFTTTATTLLVTKEQEKVRVAVYPKVWLYVSPIIFFMGVVGNSLTILVMKRKRLRRSTTAVYLIVLAVSDTAALVTRMPAEFFEAAGVGSFKDINRWTCRFEKFLFYTFSDIAIWILVLFTADRFIAVCLPFYKAKICFPKRALTACGVASLMLVGKNFHVFWTRGEEYDIAGNVKVKCGRPAFVFEQFIRPWIAFTTITLIPFLIIASCNIAIVVTLIKSRRKIGLHKHRSLIRSSTNSSSAYSGTSINQGRTSNINLTTIVPWAQQTRKKSKAFTQTTVMCLSTSIAFLICVSPSIILTLGRFYWSRDPKSVYAFGVAQAVNYQLSCLNHAINFFLYCLSGQRFRRELCHSLKIGREYRTASSNQSRKGPTETPLKHSISSSSDNRLENGEACSKKLEPIEEVVTPVEKDGDSDKNNFNLPEDEKNERL